MLQTNEFYRKSKSMQVKLKLPQLILVSLILLNPYFSIAGTVDDFKEWYEKNIETGGAKPCVRGGAPVDKDEVSPERIGYAVEWLKSLAPSGSRELTDHISLPNYIPYLEAEKLLESMKRCILMGHKKMVHDMEYMQRHREKDLKSRKFHEALENKESMSYAEWCFRYAPHTVDLRVERWGALDCDFYFSKAAGYYNARNTEYTIMQHALFEYMVDEAMESEVMKEGIMKLQKDIENGQLREGSHPEYKSARDTYVANGLREWIGSYSSMVFRGE